MMNLCILGKTDVRSIY